MDQKPLVEKVQNGPKTNPIFFLKTLDAPHALLIQHIFSRL